MSFHSLELQRPTSTSSLGEQGWRSGESARLPVTSPDALPLSYRRLVGAKAIKLGSCDKRPAYC